MMNRLGSPKITLSSVSLDPVIVLVSIDKKAKACIELKGRPFVAYLLMQLSINKNDRSKASSKQEDPFINLGFVKETDEGLIGRGSKMFTSRKR